jgi:hypothetical protein
MCRSDAYGEDLSSLKLTLWMPLPLYGSLRFRGWQTINKVLIKISLLTSLSNLLHLLSTQQADPTDPIAAALEKCEKYVLRPYRFVLKMVSVVMERTAGC